MDNLDQPSTMAYRAGGRQALDVSAFAAGVSLLSVATLSVHGLYEHPKHHLHSFSSVQQLGPGSGAGASVNPNAVETVVVSVAKRRFIGRLP